MATQDHSIDSNPAPPLYPRNPWPDTPESLISGFPNAHDNSPRDLVSCVLLRAHAVTVLLFSEFSEKDRNPLDDQLVVNALWDIQGHLETAQHLVGEWEVAHA
jgi:hypothetical protein